MSIFDLIQSNEIAAYWETLSNDEPPYIGQELFPDRKQRGLSLKWIKGSKGLPVVLKSSAFDASAVPRARIGFDKLSTDMPFFKESTYVDEELRQELNIVIETGNQAYIDSVMTRVFDDETSLLRGAAASREMMRMMALTTGVISMTANGQSFTYDYGVDHKGSAATSWSNRTSADPIEDIRLAKQEILEDTGAVVTRAMCDSKTWANLRNNKNIIQAIYVMGNGTGIISDAKLKTFLQDQVEIDVVVNDKRYKNEEGDTFKFMPADTFVMFPSGALGSTWFGTTPAESDLMTSAAANVSIVDTGVAVQTSQKVDPVNVETIVSQISLPSFELADQVYIMDTEV